MPVASKPLSPSALKKIRRKAPIFIDEFIQWHLNTSEHDRCPWCGIKNVGYLGKRSRTCMNDSCGVSISRDAPSTEFLRDKLDGEEAIEYGEPNWYVVKRDGRGLLDAQKESRDGRAILRISHDRREFSIYWHIDGLRPEGADGRPACEVGSKLWYWFNNLTHYGKNHYWWPAEPLNPLEILARADTDDPVYMVRV